MSAQGGPGPAGRRALLDDLSPASADSRWTRVKAVFLEALAQPEPQRAEYVVHRYGDDSRLCAEVLSLLSSDREAGSFCEVPAGALLGLAGSGEGPGAGAPSPRLEPGTRLGVYEIEGFLRSGGMGEVYRGRHTVLGRAVAIKTVPSASGADARRRLVREARHASLLRHPNTCTIHEVGEVAGLPFIVMELVDGRPLSDLIRERSLSLGAALGHALEVADALAHAHERGIVHRDLKSSNVMIDGSGRAVVLDFGLAKRLPTHRGDVSGESITAAGAMAGTLSHMAPEVLQGGPADVRSDIWSLGVMLYELVTGRLPFRGSTPFETSAAILEGSLTWPARRPPLTLRLVIGRCLRRDPAARYQTAAQVRDALDRVRLRRTWSLTGRLLMTASPRRVPAAAVLLAGLLAAAAAGPKILDRLTGAAAPPVRSLAVLPLENTTADPRLDYYAAGLSEGLLSELGAALDVRVVDGAGGAGPGPSAAPPGGAMAGAPPVPSEADAVVRGRVRMAGGRVALDVHLMDAGTGRTLWSDTFERSPQQVLVLQSDVIRGLATALRLAFRPGATDRLVTVRAVNPEAYQAYLKGRYEWNRRTPASLDRALAHFAEAVELDPTYAPAHAALADIYSQFATVLVAKGSPLEYRPKAEAEAIRALQIDPASAEAHAALGYVQHYDLRWEQSERSFLRAMALNPSYPLAHLWHANLLMSRHRFDEALEHAEMARALDPYSLIVNANIGWILLAADRPEEALAHLRWTVSLDSTYVQARVRLVGALASLGQLEEARAEAARVVALSQRSPHSVGMLGMLEAESGHTAQARALLAELLERETHEYVPPATISGLFEALGEVEPAVEWLIRSFEERSNAVAYFTLRPERGGVHADPRIQALAAARGSS